MLGGGEKDGEAGAAERGSGVVDRALALFDDAPADSQAEAGAGLFRREIGFEQLVEVLLAYTGTVVFHVDAPLRIFIRRDR